MAANENWTFEIALTTQPDDPNPVYVDFTSRVDGQIEIVTGDTAETTGATGTLSLRLNNSDQALTPGNVVSPHYPYIKSARKCRVRETIAGTTYDLFTGYIEFPEIEAWTSSSATAPRDQTITITAVDRLARLQRSPTFISTLAEHIAYHGRNTLIGHWPLLERAAPVDSLPSGQPLTQEIVNVAVGFIPSDPPQPKISYAGGATAPGDDAAMMNFQPSRDTSVPPVFIDCPTLTGAVAYSISAGQVMTTIAWVNLDAVNALGEILSVTASALGNWAKIMIDSTGSSLRGEVQSSAWSGAVDAPLPGYVRTVPVALRFGFSPAVLEVWCGDTVTTGTMTVTSAVAKSYVKVLIGAIDGSVGYAQVHLGAEGDFTHDDYLAQYEVGTQGHERQLTGERIRTALQYGGVAASDLHNIDDGTAVMSRASLAGKTSADVAFEAAITEQGSLTVNGSGLFDFADRRRIHNV